MSTTRAFPKYIDGYYGTPRPVSRRPKEFPFESLGDITAAKFTETLMVDQASYAPVALGTVHYDSAYSGYYLHAQTKPAIDQGDIAPITREYRNIPGDQVDYITRVLPKPNPSSVGTATNDFVDGPGGAVLGAGVAYGLYRFGNNQVYGPIATVTSVASGSDTRVTWTAHGVAGTEQILARAVVGGTTRYAIFSPGEYTVVNANTIDLLGIVSGLGGTGVIEMGKYLRDYTPGSVRARLRTTQSFYLPGVTVGITDAEDIPVPATLINDADFLDAVIANLTGYLTYDASDLAHWDGGPIYTQTQQAIDMSTL